MLKKTALTKNLLSAVDAFQYITQAAIEGSPAVCMFTGNAGLGKTTAGEYLFIESAGLLMRCRKADTLGSVIERLALELGLPKRQRKNDMIDYIVQELAELNKPLFIDESDYLANKPEVLEGFRDIYDMSNVPMIFIGYAQLPRAIKRLPQLASRISQHVEFKPADTDDLMILSETVLPQLNISECLLDELRAAAKGNFRQIHTGLGSIERFAQANSLSSINAQQWANQMFFPSI